MPASPTMNASDPAEANSDLEARIEELNSHIHHSRYAEAAALAAQLWDEGARDVRVLGPCYFGPFLAKGAAALPGILESVLRSVGPELPDLGPARKKHELLDSTLGWLFGALHKQLTFAHQDQGGKKVLAVDPVLRRPLREALTPRYTLGCKRILLSNDYYPAVQRDNVAIITSPITRVTPNGVRCADGVERKLDVLILATGFQASEHVAPFPLRGRAGRDLSEHWAETGPEAYLGTTVSGFPNLFIMTGPNTGLGHSSMVLMIESQITYVLGALRALRLTRAVDVRPEVQAAYNQELQAKLARTVWQTGGCSSWYQTAGGKNTTLWPGYTFGYRHATRRFDSENYTIDPRPPLVTGELAQTAPLRAEAALCTPGGEAALP